MSKDLEDKIITMFFDDTITFNDGEAESVKTLDLSELNLYEHLLTSDNLPVLQNILSRLINLEEINLDRNGIRDDMAGWLKALEQCNLSNLKEIIWDYAPRLSSKKDASNLYESISLHPKLKTIKFGTQLGNEAKENMDAEFKNMSAWGKSEEPGFLNSFEWHYLCDAFKNCKNITTIDLSYMYVGFWAEKAIVSILKSPSSFINNINYKNYNYIDKEDPGEYTARGVFITNAFDVRKARSRFITLLSARETTDRLGIKYKPAIIRLPADIIRLVAKTVGVPVLKKINSAEFISTLKLT